MSDLRLKCTKIDFGWRAPGHAGEAYSTLSDRTDPVAGIKVRGGMLGGDGEDREGKAGDGTGGKAKGGDPLHFP